MQSTRLDFDVFGVQGRCEDLGDFFTEGLGAEAVETAGPVDLHVVFEENGGIIERRHRRVCNSLVDRLTTSKCRANQAASCDDERPVDKGGRMRGAEECPTDEM